jgi:hypothetical protein
MTERFNAPYRRRFPDPDQWPSNNGSFASRAAEVTRQRINELSWEMAGQQVADEIEQVLAGDVPMPPSHRPARRLRRGDPGE